MGIKDTIFKSINGDERSIKLLCDECHRIAVAYLRTKRSRHDLLLKYLFTDVNDLALDCVADLFYRTDGQLEQFTNYFNEDTISDQAEEEVLIDLRRLVFSKVNEGLFRNFQRFDPSLSRIIRNLKRTLEEEKVHGARYDSKKSSINFGLNKESLPVIPNEILEIRLSARVSNIQNTVDAVEELRSILSKEERYASKYNLVGFAVILRKVFAYQLEMEDEQELKNTYNEMELNRFLMASISLLKTQLFKTYVVSKKLSASTFDKYLQTTRSILESEYVKESVHEGYFEHFESFFPEVTYDEYRSNHRKTLEYWVKKVRDKMLYEVKKEENFSRYDDRKGLIYSNVNVSR
ncbi:hypothetical protein [Gracilimonas amylolytica]|uniref:hypothetical protein n=1 Tax=Gracilimonas amylolytica TaxID=1749045 RepID=UPI000CD8594D|nr:hypothetical protein [Gracilimonas amylolytica]